MPYTGTNPEQFDKLLRVILECDVNEGDFYAQDTNLLIPPTYRDINEIAEKLNTLKNSDNKRVLIPYSCSSPSNPFNIIPYVKRFLPSQIVNSVNSELPYQHYVLFDVDINDGRINIALYDPALGSRLDSNLIERELREIVDIYTYRQMALNMQNFYGDDSVNCGKYLISFIYYLANFEKNKGLEEVDDFVLVHDDALDSVINSQNFNDLKPQFFSLLQEMIDLDNDASIRKQEACTSQILCDDDEGFEVLSDSSEEEKSSGIGSTEEIEQYNVESLRVIASEINNIISGNKENSFSNKIKSERVHQLQLKERER